MLITLLGTGSADGWPNAFCECESCEVERAAGRSRRPSSALVDDLILIDCGPAAAHAANAAGRSLRGVEHVLITHGHPDHLDPAFLLSRHWTSTEEQLTIWGPAQAIERCRDWIAPGDPVHLNVVSPGDRVSLPTAHGDYSLLVLPAAHSSGNGDVLAEEAVLLDVTAPNGERLLYATDTGPLPASTIEMVTDAVDMLILDETFGLHGTHGTGHLDLQTFRETVAALRVCGVVAASTQVVATHLSHHNPSDLRSRLRADGVRVPSDLDVIDSDRPERPGGQRLLVLGGARSGKSTYAERMAAAWSNEVTYVATSGHRGDDAEWAKRIASHQARRPAAWTTIETLDLVATLGSAKAGSVVLIDCLTLWLTGQLDILDAWTRSDLGEATEIETEVMHVVDLLTDSLGSTAADVILVSNEVGWGVVPATSSGRLFRDLMGRVNSAVAVACDRSVLVVAGRGLPLHELEIQ